MRLVSQLLRLSLLRVDRGIKKRIPRISDSRNSGLSFPFLLQKHSLRTAPPATLLKAAILREKTVYTVSPRAREHRFAFSQTRAKTIAGVALATNDPSSGLLHSRATAKYSARLFIHQHLEEIRRASPHNAAARDVLRYIYIHAPLNDHRSRCFSHLFRRRVSS